MKAEDLHVAPVITWWNKRNAWAEESPPEPLSAGFDEGDRCQGRDADAGNELGRATDCAVEKLKERKQTASLEVPWVRE